MHIPGTLTIHALYGFRTYDDAFVVHYVMVVTVARYTERVATNY